ncbi:PAS domain S-box protein [Sulfuricurvum sp.]|uniref:PAS domain S-box protein n=1 Tax=Sulfuricurvum sp. TaxID=2025608 RepID=UPI00262F5745|nr:PAS domain S-box protein [Sulfuricurvum sp.]MDD2782265.1 PAS domain S-box protein [Sulfuricurvum sp.]
MSDTKEETISKITFAHQEWLCALDAVSYPIFLHDKEFRILRCNKAYSQYVGIPYSEIIGQKYYELFPKNDGPLPHCTEALEDPLSEGSEEDIQIEDKIFHSKGFIIKDPEGHYLYSLHILEDITDKRQIEQALRESEAKFRTITTSAQDAILMMDDKGEISFWNEAAVKTFGYTEKEAIGKSLHALLTPERFLAAHYQGFEHFKQTGEGPAIGKTLELAALRKDGTEFPIELSLSVVMIEGQRHAIGVIRDITERKQVETLLKEERDFSDRLVETAPVIILILNPQGQIIRFNTYMETLSGYTLDEVKGKDWFTTFLPEADRVKTKALFLSAIDDIQTQGNTTIILTKEGESRAIEWYDKTLKTLQGNNIGLLAIGLDVTERKKNQELLRQSKEKFRALVESTNDLIWEIDQNGKYSYLSPSVETLLGYTPQEVLGKSPFDFMPPEESQRLGAVFQKLVSEQAPILTLENTNICKDGTIKVLETSGVPYFNEKGELSGYRGIDRDISERKRFELSLSRANRALQTLSAGNMALVRAKNESELLQEITNIIVKQAGYNLAAVVYAEETAQKNITLVAGAGIAGENHDWANDITWDDTPNGQLPVSYAIRTGTTQVCHNVACALGTKLWKDTVLSKGYVSNIALPLSNANKTFGALCIYSTDENAFDPEEIHLLEELTNDLAYGILNLRTRIEHEQHALLLRQSLEQSIQTIAATVEARDPYTAGHQHRVSELATAIAHEMALSENQIQGIRLAATIHDLGKIHIPAEILSKPGRLNKIEFMLIQTHPEEGYNILKDVKFPWPIADIILQHHEKLDGSGYPQGLKGDEILLEAKIICVADIVEAMSSHRPYRPSLGIEPALEEIKRGRGIWYEPSVVDVCLKLFEENRFQFSNMQPKSDR